MGILFSSQTLDFLPDSRYNSNVIVLGNIAFYATVAQSVEQLIRNQQVSGSNPLSSSMFNRLTMPFVLGWAVSFFDLVTAVGVYSS